VVTEQPSTRIIQVKTDDRVLGVHGLVRHRSDRFTRPVRKGAQYDQK
jgi:hypothetical protein